MNTPRQMTQQFMDEHDYLMLVPQFLVDSTGREPEDLILELAQKDLSSFEIMNNVDDKIHGLNRGEIKFYKPYILPIKEYPQRYTSLKKFIEDTVMQSKESEKIEFNAENFSFEFDKKEIEGKNIKYFRIVRLLKEGEELKQEVPEPSYFFHKRI